MTIDQFTDQEIVAALLRRDTVATEEFLYMKCNSLFRSIFNKYYTDCEDSKEFTNEIYEYIMTPGKETGRCKLEDFGFRCTLTMWLKIVSVNYCHQLYIRKDNLRTISLDDSDRKWTTDYSLEPDIKSLNMSDVLKIIEMMPNERYRKLIYFRYIDENSNDETAKLLSMTMDVYYNKHRLAKAQFCRILRKEGLLR